MYHFDEPLIQTLEYQLLSKLPDLFTMEDGTRVTTPEQWQDRRKELYRTAVELQYGVMPPKPEILEVEPLDSGDDIRSYRIITGTRKTPVSFIMRVIRPSKPGVYPAIVDGDLCWKYSFDRDYLNAVIGQNVMLVLFNRTELVPDRLDCGRNGPLYRTYPDYTFSAIGAWAWGYARCVDALEQLGIADLDHIAFCGHSRGGKTALLAGVLDERACIVNPNDSGAGGAGCYRVRMKAVQEDGKEHRSERLSDLMGPVPFWFGPEMPAYIDREGELPFDQHFLKALIAPRILLETEAASDIWANPIGSYQTALAAKEAYRLLDAEENLLLYYRRGYHFHKPEDIGLLAKILNQKIAGEAFEEGSFRLPFEPVEPAFDWACPTTKGR